MKIITVNLPDSYVNAMNCLIGENGLYPSRSELVRIAVRDFLLKSLEEAEHLKTLLGPLGVPKPLVDHFKMDEEISAIGAMKKAIADEPSHEPKRKPKSTIPQKLKAREAYSLVDVPIEFADGTVGIEKKWVKKIIA